MASRWKMVEMCEGDDRLPKVPAVYAVYCDGSLVYIGSTVNLYFRTMSYTKVGYSNFLTTPWGQFLRVFIKYSTSRKLGDWAMREIRLIHRLKPANNKTYTGKSRTAK
jgi:hypothetical protein